MSTTHKKITKSALFFVVFVLNFLYSCSTTYQYKSSEFQKQIALGNNDAALEAIEKNKFLHQKRNQLLYFLEKGKIAHLNQEYKLSNSLFNSADALIENEQKAIGNILLSVAINAEKETYKGEDFEKVAIHYYKALNYAFLNQLDEAIVEARRITLQLQKINDSYPDKQKNRYKDDAFAHNLQGLLYEASGDSNNAFIAYRHAIDLYLEYEGSYLGVPAPEQLKQDVLRMADIMGFVDELERYESLLNTTYIKTSKTIGGDGIIFWENGLAPYKDQTYYSFAVLPSGNNGIFHIHNEDLNLTIPFPFYSNSENNTLDIFNVAFPKYVPRKSIYTNASIKLETKDYNFELAESYDQIAVKTLRDRTLREVGKVALRLATKKASEYTLKNQNEALGTILGIINAVTEAADTRNWQSLPSEIYYSRIPLKKGGNTIEIALQNDQGITTPQKILLQGNGKMQFQTITSPQTFQSNQSNSLDNEVRHYND